MLSFRGFLFFTNLSYKFCFPLDDFEKPLVIQVFCRVFLLIEIVLRGNARSHTLEKTLKKYS